MKKYAIWIFTFCFILLIWQGTGLAPVVAQDSDNIPFIVISSPSNIDADSAVVQIEGTVSHNDAVLSIENQDAAEVRVVPVSKLLTSGDKFILRLNSPKVEGEKITYAITVSRLWVYSSTDTTSITITYKPSFMTKIISSVKSNASKLMAKLRLAQKPKVVKPVPIPNIYMPQPNDAQKKWLLASGAIISTQNREGFDGLKVKLPEGAVKQILSQWWDVTDRTTAVKTINWLWKEGHRIPFENESKMISLYTRYDKNTYQNMRTALLDERIADEETIQSYDFVFNHGKSLAGQSLTAWDFVRLVNVCRWSYSVGYITEYEAWMFMMNAGRQLQSNYHSWKELADHYLLGRTYWLHTSNHPETSTFINYLLGNPANDSIWNKVSWKADFGKPPPDEYGLAFYTQQDVIDSSAECTKYPEKTEPAIQVKLINSSSKDKIEVLLTAPPYCAGTFSTLQHTVSGNQTSYVSPRLHPGIYSVAVTKNGYEGVIMKTMKMSATQVYDWEVDMSDF